MATQVFSNAFISIAGVDLSDHCKSLSLSQNVETGDKTAMGDDTRAMKAGLEVWQVQASFHADFAAGELDATIAGLTNREAALVIRPDAGVKSVTNPEYTGTGVLTSYTPFGGSVGDTPTEASVTFEPAGTLTRDAS